jgi:hypothetical protein
MVMTQGLCIKALEVIRSFPADLDYSRVIRHVGVVNSEEVKSLAELGINTNPKTWSKEFSALVVKIHNFLTADYDLDPVTLSIETTTILEKIIEDKHFQQVFRKPPKKQSVPERCLEEHIRVFALEYNNLFRTPCRPKATYILEGEFLSKKPRQRKIKSVDLQISLHQNKHYYLFHKFAEGQGGSQDNSETDVISCLEHAAKNKDTKRRFVFVCDGSKFDPILDKMKRDQTKDNIIVCSTPELKTTLVLNAVSWSR